MLCQLVESIALTGRKCTSEDLFLHSRTDLARMGITSKNRPFEYLRNLRTKHVASAVFTREVLEMLHQDPAELQRAKGSWAWFGKMNVLEHRLVYATLQRVLGDWRTAKQEKHEAGAVAAAAWWGLSVEV